MRSQEMELGGNQPDSFFIPDRLFNLFPRPKRWQARQALRLVTAAQERLTEAKNAQIPVLSRRILTADGEKIAVFTVSSASQAHITGLEQMRQILSSALLSKGRDGAELGVIPDFLSIMAQTQQGK